jgi:hypothetical protein
MPRVGVDIEAIEASHAEAGLLGRHVERAVVDEIEAALRGGDVAPFFRWWTIVEAMGKARGTGIAEDPSRLADANWLSGVDLPDDHGVLRRWRVQSWQSEPGFIAALAESISLY